MERSLHQPVDFSYSQTMLALTELARLRAIVEEADDDPEGSMRHMLEALLPILPPMAARLVYELVLRVNPEEIVDDYDMGLDQRSNP